MKTILLPAAATLAVALAGCNTTSSTDRAIVGGAIGAGTGALVGSAVGGTGAAVAGGVIGGATGAAIGASTTPAYGGCYTHDRYGRRIAVRC